MRVIAGRFKGRKLKSFDEDHIRPMTDRVKESVFNIISQRLENARVLDLYSGTGSLGIEALSRGSRFVHFVEKDPRSIRIIVSNLEDLGVSEGIDIAKSDVLKFIPKYMGEPFDVILIDPPFPLRLGSSTLDEIAKSTILRPQGVVVIEHSSQELLETRYGPLFRNDERQYGDKKVSFYQASR